MSAHLEGRPDLDRDPAPVDARPGLGDVDGLVHRVGLDDRVPAEHLLGLDERPVGDRAGPDGFRRLRPLKLVPAVEPAGRAPLLVPGADLGVPGAVLGGVRLRLVRRVQQKQYVLHASLLLVAGARLPAPYTHPTNAIRANPTRREDYAGLFCTRDRLLARQTRRRPDQSSSTAATFTSTRPRSRAQDRTTLSVMSLTWPAARRGHNAHTAPAGKTRLPSVGSRSVISAAARKNATITSAGSPAPEMRIPPG